MRRNRSRLINLAWITAVVSGLMFSVAAPAPVLADPGEWDPTLPAQISAGAPGDPLAVANASLQATAQATQTTDRKSTRLNSSHMSISYAVFCLKKKRKL